MIEYTFSAVAILLVLGALQLQANNKLKFISLKSDKFQQQLIGTNLELPIHYISSVFYNTLVQKSLMKIH